MQLRRSGSDQSAFIKAMDQSLVDVAKAEFRELSHGKDRQYVVERTIYALNELKKLQPQQGHTGESPNYDDRWVALFYLTWYQPGQVSLARRVIELGCQTRGKPALQSLHLKDFGSGALAVQFAVSWAAEEYFGGGGAIESIKVDSYDICRPMVELGIKHWEKFKLRAKNNPTLNRVCRRIVEPR